MYTIDFSVEDPKLNIFLLDLHLKIKFMHYAIYLEIIRLLLLIKVVIRGYQDDILS